MINNKIIKNRLDEYDIKTSDVMDLIHSYAVKEEPVYIYTSHLEGLGFPTSDFDVYVVYDDISKLKLNFSGEESKCIIKKTIINGCSFDIEFWERSAIDSIIDNISNSERVMLPELKLISKIAHSVYIKKSNTLDNLQKNIDLNALKKAIVKIYLFYAQSELDDALDFHETGDFVSSVIIGRNSLRNLGGAYNALNNKLNAKSKWISQILTKGDLGKSIFTNNYLKYQLENPIKKGGFELFSENMITFITENISSITMGAEN